jgi:hypothetical protein
MSSSYVSEDVRVPTCARSSTLARLHEAELAIEVVRVAGVEVPLRAGEWPFVDREPHELDSESSSTVLLEHVDVREVRLHVPVGDRT